MITIEAAEITRHTAIGFLDMTETVIRAWVEDDSGIVPNTTRDFPKGTTMDCIYDKMFYVWESAHREIRTNETC